MLRRTKFQDYCLQKLDLSLGAAQVLNDLYIAVLAKFVVAHFHRTRVSSDKHAKSKKYADYLFKLIKTRSNPLTRKRF